MNTNFNPKPPRFQERKSPTRVSAPNELLWALIGLLLTIFSTYIEVAITTPPWTWGEGEIHSVPLGITYQVGAVLLVGCLGGKNAGALSQIAYLLIGLAWLPVFARGGGLAYWQQPTFGYLIGFIPGAWLCGWMAFRRQATLESLALSAACGLSVIHASGLVYLLGLSYFASLSPSPLLLPHLPEAVMTYSVHPLPGQAAVVCAVAAIAFFLRYLLLY